MPLTQSEGERSGHRQAVYRGLEKIPASEYPPKDSSTIDPLLILPPSWIACLPSPPFLMIFRHSLSHHVYLVTFSSSLFIIYSFQYSPIKYFRLMQPVSSFFFSIFAHLHKTYITASDIYRCPKSSSSPFFYSHVHSPLFVAPCHRSHSIPSQSYVRSLFYFRQHSCAGSRSSDFPYTIECDAPLRYGSTLNKHAPSLLVCGGGGGRG